MCDKTSLGKCSEAKSSLGNGSRKYIFPNTLRKSSLILNNSSATRNEEFQWLNDSSVEKGHFVNYGDDQTFLAIIRPCDILETKVLTVSSGHFISEQKISLFHVKLE